MQSLWRLFSTSPSDLSNTGLTVASHFYLSSPPYQDTSFLVDESLGKHTFTTLKWDDSFRVPKTAITQHPMAPLAAAREHPRSSKVSALWEKFKFHAFYGTTSSFFTAGMYWWFCQNDKNSIFSTLIPMFFLGPLTGFLSNMVWNEPVQDGVVRPKLAKFISRAGLTRLMPSLSQSEGMATFAWHQLSYRAITHNRLADEFISKWLNGNIDESFVAKLNSELNFQTAQHQKPILKFPYLTWGAAALLTGVAMYLTVGVAEQNEGQERDKLLFILLQTFVSNVLSPLFHRAIMSNVLEFGIRPLLVKLNRLKPVLPNLKGVLEVPDMQRDNRSFNNITLSLCSHLQVLQNIMASPTADQEDLMAMACSALLKSGQEIHRDIQEEANKAGWKLQEDLTAQV